MAGPAAPGARDHRIEGSAARGAGREWYGCRRRRWLPGCTGRAARVESVRAAGRRFGVRLRAAGAIDVTCRVGRHGSTSACEAHSDPSARKSQPWQRGSESPPREHLGGGGCLAAACRRSHEHRSHGDPIPLDLTYSIRRAAIPVQGWCCGSAVRDQVGRAVALHPRSAHPAVMAGCERRGPQGRPTGDRLRRQTLDRRLRPKFSAVRGWRAAGERAVASRSTGHRAVRSCVPLAGRPAPRGKPARRPADTSGRASEGRELGIQQRERAQVRQEASIHVPPPHRALCDAQASPAVDVTMAAEVALCHAGCAREAP